MTEPAKKGRGGARPGAGRKPKNRAALPDLDITHALAAPAPEEIETTAQRYARTSIAALVKVLISGVNETARINAAKEILDRGYGKPAVDVGGFTQLPLFGGVSMKPIGGEIRTEARRYANLAIEALRKIADDGRSEAPGYRPRKRSSTVGSAPSRRRNSTRRRGRRPQRWRRPNAPPANGMVWSIDAVARLF